ncbi:hypothetical protein E4P41_00010 [Geodermatophilus sp. DF01-2]|uniref:hypothetical protein n=1 Tax=Geodermatophilus sp. DF01-2 TaxID=2559610 RepID=UPI0010736107|nr:hypothetical protein [Geodermatophilus sp. DF01_2]TFV64669.1 hypothetical protein E4P41_00010 [Geodermatophilus sp. DF01_2]
MSPSHRVSGPRVPSFSRRMLSLIGETCTRPVALLVALGCLVPLADDVAGTVVASPGVDHAAARSGVAGSVVDPADRPDAEAAAASARVLVEEATRSLRADALARARADTLPLPTPARETAAAARTAPDPSPTPGTGSTATTTMTPGTGSTATTTMTPGTGSTAMTPGTGSTATAPVAPAAVTAETAAAATTDPEAGSVSGAGGPLSWAPPAGYTSYPVKRVTATDSLTTVNGRGGDVYVQLSPDHPVGPIAITDCRNAVVIGGHITVLPSATVNGADQRAIYVRNCTGTVHIEGVHIDGAVSGAQSDGIAVNAPKAVLQIQNVRVDGLRGGASGNHADVFQPWGGVREFRIDRLSGSSNFQGLHIFENRGEIGRGIIRNTDIAGTDVKPIDKGGYYIWTDCDDDYPLLLDNVYVTPRPGRPFSQSVWPSVTHKECPAKVSEGMATWPADDSITGGVHEGRPSSGAFVPAGTVGLGYTSPGY